MAEKLDAYLNARQATPLGFSPKGQLLIATRFGDVEQLHLVERPAGERRQLTFLHEPITQAAFSPDPATAPLCISRMWEAMKTRSSTTSGWANPAQTVDRRQVAERRPGMVEHRPRNRVLQHRSRRREPRHRHRRTGGGIAAAPRRHRRQRRLVSARLVAGRPQAAGIEVRVDLRSVSVRGGFVLGPKARGRALAGQSGDHRRQILPRRSGRVFDFGPRQRVFAAALRESLQRRQDGNFRPYFLGRRGVGDFARRPLPGLCQQRGAGSTSSMCSICAPTRI